MTEQLQAKMQIIDNMTVDGLKAMTIFNFDEFASGISHREARTLIVHFFDRLGRTLQRLPSVDFGYGDIEGISCDFKVLEVILDRFFLDFLPDVEERIPDLPESVKREFFATTDIYNTYSERIREELDSYLED